jgi:hypothetical protein
MQEGICDDCDTELAEYTFFMGKEIRIMKVQVFFVCIR